MWRCEDVDQQMWGCEDVDLQMWRCEDIDLQMYYNGCFFTKNPSQALSGKRESLRRKKIQVREKVGKSRNTVFFQWYVAPEGRQ